MANLKHAYYFISLHLDNRHIFTFTIKDISQLQHTKMPQSAKLAGFIINKLVYQAFEAINNASLEFLLLYFKENNQLLILTFYIDDFFEGFKDFKIQF